MRERWKREVIVAAALSGYGHVNVRKLAADVELSEKTVRDILDDKPGPSTAAHERVIRALGLEGGE